MYIRKCVLSELHAGACTADSLMCCSCQFKHLDTRRHESYTNCELCIPFRQGAKRWKDGSTTRKYTLFCCRKDYVESGTQLIRGQHMPCIFLAHSVEKEVP